MTETKIKNVFNEKGADMSFDIELIRELLEGAYKMNKEDSEPASLKALRYAVPELKNYRVNELKTLLQSIERLVPNYVHLTEDIISMNTTPEKIMGTLNKAYTSE